MVTRRRIACRWCADVLRQRRAASSGFLAATVLRLLTLDGFLIGAVSRTNSPALILRTYRHRDRRRDLSHGKSTCKLAVGRRWHARHHPPKNNAAQVIHTAFTRLNSYNPSRLLTRLLLISGSKVPSPCAPANKIKRFRPDKWLAKRLHRLAGVIPGVTVRPATVRPRRHAAPGQKADCARSPYPNVTAKHPPVN